MRGKARAKLNLRLQVLGKREDGYHLIDTDMVPITLGDMIGLRRRTDGQIRLWNHKGVPPETDLAGKAARALRERAAYAAGADIVVEKGIPIGAGMGGGSSDAAAVLLGLNKLWSVGASDSELLEIALEVGTDVPFFLYGEPKWATGVGDKLEPCYLPDYPRRCLVVAPNRGLDTAAVYRKWDDLLESPASPEVCELAERMGMNDLTAAALEIGPPEMRQAAKVLLDMFGDATMTGSGSAVFAVGVPPGARKLCLPFLPEGARSAVVHWDHDGMRAFDRGRVFGE